jgi:hypothetical protein
MARPLRSGKKINPIAVRLIGKFFKVSDCSLLASHDDGLVTHQPVFVKIFSPLAKVFSFS